MRRFFTIFRRGSNAVLVALIISFFLILPLFRCWPLRSSLLTALDTASSVRVVEHSDPFDYLQADTGAYQETIYSTVTLTPDQIKSLHRALPLSLDYSFVVMLACYFQEHHRVEIVQRDGKILILHICFHCGELALNNKNQRLMPLGWPSSLKTFLKTLGLRPDGPFGDRKS